MMFNSFAVNMSKLISLCFQDLLVTVYENGSLVQDYTLEEIRKNARLRDEDVNPTLHNQDQELLRNHILNGVH